MGSEGQWRNQTREVTRSDLSRGLLSFSKGCTAACACTIARVLIGRPRRGWFDFMQRLCRRRF